MIKWMIQSFIVLLFLVACNKATQISVPLQAPVLVVNGQWQQNALLLLRVTKSRGITDPFDTGYALFNTYEVRNALVTVKENDILIDTLKYDTLNYFYRSIHNKRAKLNKVYTVNASSPGLASINTASPLLSLMTITGTQLKTGVSHNASGDLMDEISFSFSDDQSKTDYYLIRIRKANGDYAECINTADQDFEKLIFNTPFTTETCFDGDKLLLSDKNFNGRIKKVILSVSADQMEDITFTGQTNHPYIELLHISEDFFKYIKSTNGNDISSVNPFSEPVNIYSNIKNGYGFFTAFSLSADSLHR